MLEERDAPVAVVEAIAGATRAEVTFTGRAGHAGTVPMAGRRDAACGLADFVLAVEAAGNATGGLVATVGQLAVRPGAPNVIPGAATASLDVRHADDAVRGSAVSRLRARAEAIGDARGLEVAWEERLATAAVAMDAALSGRLAAAVEAAGPAARPPAERRRARRGRPVRAHRHRDALRPLRRRRQPPPGRVGRGRGRRRRARRPRPLRARPRRVTS